MQKNIQNNGVDLSRDLKHSHMSVNGGLMQIGELLVEHIYGHIDAWWETTKTQILLREVLFRTKIYMVVRIFLEIISNLKYLISNVRIEI